MKRFIIVLLATLPSMLFCPPKRTDMPGMALMLAKSTEVMIRDSNTTNTKIIESNFWQLTEYAKVGNPIAQEYIPKLLFKLSYRLVIHQDIEENGFTYRVKEVTTNFKPLALQAIFPITAKEAKILDKELWPPQLSFEELKLAASMNKLNISK